MDGRKLQTENNERMKIVYCIAGTFNPGGMERVLSNKTNYLAKHGHEVYIVTTDQRNQSSFFYFHPSIKHYDLGINYDENNGKGFFNKLIKFPGKQLLHRKKLSEFLIKLKPDITISMFNNDVSFIPNIKDGSKKVLEIHFSKFKKMQYQRKGLWKLADSWRTKEEEKWVKKFDRFVVLTEEDKCYWGNLQNIEVIPNALSKIPETTSKLDIKNVVAIGRYNSQKGFDRLIDIWSVVHNECPDWHLNILGEGDLKESLQRQIDELNLSENVHLTRPTKDVEQIYLNSSILALTSRYEGLPMVLLEAQSYGLPIVAYDCKCGPLDVITDGEDGFIVRDGNKQYFAEKIKQLILSKDLRERMGKKGKAASFRFEEDKIMNRWIDLFQNLVEK